MSKLSEILHKIPFGHADRRPVVQNKEADKTRNQTERFWVEAFMHTNNIQADISQAIDWNSVAQPSDFDREYLSIAISSELTRRKIAQLKLAPNLKGVALRKIDSLQDQRIQYCLTAYPNEAKFFENNPDLHTKYVDVIRQAAENIAEISSSPTANQAWEYKTQLPQLFNTLREVKATGV